MTTLTEKEILAIKRLMKSYGYPFENFEHLFSTFVRVWTVATLGFPPTLESVNKETRLTLEHLERQKHESTAM